MTCMKARSTLDPGSLGIECRRFWKTKMMKARLIGNVHNEAERKYSPSMPRV